MSRVPKKYGGLVEKLKKATRKITKATTKLITTGVAMTILGTSGVSAQPYLNWDASTSKDVDGYRIYGTQEGITSRLGDTHSPNITEYPISSLAFNRNKSFVIFTARAYNKAGESVNSNTVLYMVPANDATGPDYRVIGKVGNTYIFESDSAEPFTLISKFDDKMSFVFPKNGVVSLDLSSVYEVVNNPDNKQYVGLGIVDPQGNESTLEIPMGTYSGDVSGFEYIGEKTTEYNIDPNQDAGTIAKLTIPVNMTGVTQFLTGADANKYFIGIPAKCSKIINGGSIQIVNDLMQVLDYGTINLTNPNRVQVYVLDLTKNTAGDLLTFNWDQKPKVVTYIPTDSLAGVTPVEVGKIFFSNNGLIINSGLQVVGDVTTSGSITNYDVVPEQVLPISFSLSASLDRRSRERFPVVAYNCPEKSMLNKSLVAIIDLDTTAYNNMRFEGVQIEFEDLAGEYATFKVPKALLMPGKNYFNKSLEDMVQSDSFDPNAPGDLYIYNPTQVSKAFATPSGTYTIFTVNDN